MALCGIVHRGQDTFCQNFAELYAPLVEAVNIPENALYEDFVFIERDQHTEMKGIETVEEDRRRWVVAVENFLRVVIGMREVAAFHQGLSLCKHIGNQYIVLVLVR